MPELKRFDGTQRFFHVVLVVTFMILSVTGLVWMFIQTELGSRAATAMGGYTLVIEVHRITGLVLIAAFVLHVIHVLVRLDWRHIGRSVLGPDSIVFLWRDVLEFFRHLGWVVGICKSPPRFDRWNWWEKFDYWGVWWGMVILGVTGLILYDPVLTSDFAPGWMLNVMLWVHRVEAILAMAHIFTVHFFIENFRPAAFPFGDAIFSGSTELDDARREHPAWVERLERNGQLDAALVPRVPIPIRILYFGFGYAIIALGVVLVVYSIANVAYVTL